MAIAPLSRKSLVKAMWSASGTASEALLPGVTVPDSHVEFVFHLARLFSRVMWSLPSDGLAGLSRELGWSDRGLRRVINQATGLSPKDVQLAGRHLDACALLRERPELDITEIAGRVGFFDHAAFTHSFRKRLGMTPSQFCAESHAFYERRP